MKSIITAILCAVTVAVKFTIIAILGMCSSPPSLHIGTPCSLTITSDDYNSLLPTSRISINHGWVDGKPGNGPIVLGPGEAYMFLFHRLDPGGAHWRNWMWEDMDHLNADVSHEHIQPIDWIHSGIANDLYVNPHAFVISLTPSILGLTVTGLDARIDHCETQDGRLVIVQNAGCSPWPL